jgi:transposase
VETLAEQLNTEDVEAPIFVADSGLYSADNVVQLSAAGVRWISRVPDTSTAARAALAVADDAWQQEGTLSWAAAQAPAGERWVVVRTTASEERAGAILQRQVEAARQTWERALWHLGNQRFACAPDAEAALAQQLKQLLPWLAVHRQLTAHPKQNRPGRPRASTTPDRTEWQVAATLAVEAEAVTRAVQRKASFLVATNVLDTDHLADQELIQTYQEQHSVERGFSFLKDPPVSGLVRLRQEAIPHHRPQPRDDTLPAGLSARRAPAAHAARGHRPDGAQPTQAADGSPDDALDVSVFRRDQPGRIATACRPATTQYRWPGATT